MGTYSLNFVKDIILKPISKALASAMIEKYHYTHNAPHAIINYGVYYKEKLKGVIVFGKPAGRHVHGIVKNTKPHQMVELTRLWLHDDMPKNSESKVISIALKILKKHSKLKWVISYADTNAEHLGIIYQATNWKYVGTGGASIRYKIGDKTYHTRSVGAKLGSQNADYLKSKFPNIEKIKQKPKHCYVYFIDDKYQEYLLKPIRPYPKVRA